MPTRYEEDFYLWSQETAQALRDRRFDHIDMEHVAEEIGDLGKSERRDLANRIRVLMTHLLKLKFQPERRSRSWDATIRLQRKEVQKLLRRTRSLRRFVAEEIAEMYDLAVEYAAEETGIAPECFPRECPFTVVDVMGRLVQGVNCMPTRYEQDFYLWSQETTEALLERRFDDIDMEHVAEEIRNLGASQRQELRSRLKVLLVHRLNCRYATERNPSLRQHVPELIRDVYPKTVRAAAREPRATFRFFRPNARSPQSRSWASSLPA